MLLRLFFHFAHNARLIYGHCVFEICPTDGFLEKCHFRKKKKKKRFCVRKAEPHKHLCA